MLFKFLFLESILAHNTNFKKNNIKGLVIYNMPAQKFGKVVDEE
jgi:hypothetical protein